VRPGLRLAAGLALAVLASVSPAGLGGRPVPAWSWAVWAAAFAAGAHGFASAGSTSAQLARRLGWLLPVVLALALPAAVAAAAGARVETALALVARSLAATTAAAGTVFRLGPLGLLRGARALGLPERLAQVMEAALVGLVAMLERARAMLRARAARRPGGGAWERLLRAPAGTLRGFGRFGAALLLRTLERAEAQERARRARGADLA
jgi:energy-coupling factor transporter transmembrane protein EcfT